MDQCGTVLTVRIRTTKIRKRTVYTFSASTVRATFRKRRSSIVATLMWGSWTTVFDSRRAVRKPFFTNDGASALSL